MENILERAWMRQWVLESPDLWSPLRHSCILPVPYDGCVAPSDVTQKVVKMKMG